jgi:acid phosphatase type 7
MCRHQIYCLELSCSFFRYHVQMEPLIANVPYMTAIGNHERDWPDSGDRFPSMTDSGGECGVAHERRFLMPSHRQDEPW